MKAKCHEMQGVATTPTTGKKMTHEQLVRLAKKHMYNPQYRCYM